MGSSPTQWTRTGLSAGDLIHEIHRLVDPGDGSTVLGRTITRMEVLRGLNGGEDAVSYLDCTVRLAGGNIVFSGGDRLASLFDGDGVTFALTGGTGSYELVRGTVTILPQDGGGTLFTFDLTTT